MNNWDLYKRMLCNIQKAIYNPEASKQMVLHYLRLHTDLVKSPMDEDIFNDTFLKITYKYNPQLDFMDLFRWLFQLLKGAYYRDNQANHFLQLMEDRLEVPEYIPDKAPDVDTGVVSRLKAFINSPIV